MRESSQMLPQNDRSVRKKAFLVFLLCVALFTCVAIVAVVGDLYAYSEYSTMQEDLKSMELGNTFTIFEENADFFPKNQIVVNLMITILCVWYMKKDTQTYHAGLAPSGRCVGFWLPMLVVAVVYAVIKLAWKDMMTFGLNYLFQFFAVAAVVALGVYMMRKANASRQAKIWTPFVAGLLFIPSCLGNIVNSFARSGVEMERFTDIFTDGYALINPVLTSFVAFVPGLIFMIVYYHMSGDLFGGISASYLMSMLASTMAVYDGIFEITKNKHIDALYPDDKSGITLGSNKVNSGSLPEGSPELTAITNYGYYIFLIALCVAAVVLLAVLLSKKTLPSDEECDYVPLEIYTGEVEKIDLIDDLCHSSLWVITCISSAVAVVYAVASTVWYNITGFSTAFIDVFNTLFSDGKLSKDFNFWVLISFIPLVLIVVAFWLLLLTKKTETKAKSFGLIKWGTYGMILADAIVLIFMLVKGSEGFIVKYSELSYMWNALLYKMANSDMSGVTLSVLMCVGMCLLIAYHVFLAWAVKGILDPSSKKAPKTVYCAVSIASLVMAALLIVVSFFSIQTLAMIACALGGVACILVAWILFKLGVGAENENAIA